MSFLELAGYYRKFISNYGTISLPLKELLRKNEHFVWSSLADKAFHTLKLTLVEVVVLALPHFTPSFDLNIDASGLGTGTGL